MLSNTIQSLKLRFRRIGTVCRRIRRDQNGVSLIEFAVTLPVLLTMGLYGAEIARMSMTKMKLDQIALGLADNASRLGQTDNSGVTPTITENNVNSILNGALRDGIEINLKQNGRIILTSLEYDDFNRRQFIRWQRCQGALAATSAYGNDSTLNGLQGNPIYGMGQGKTKIRAFSGMAVMYVEIEYTYQALFERPFGSGDQTMRAEAAYLTRDDRNLAPGLTGGNSVSNCTQFL